MMSLHLEQWRVMVHSPMENLMIVNLILSIFISCFKPLFPLMTNVVTYLKPVPLFKRIFGIVIFIFAFFVLCYQSLLFGFFMISFAVYLSSTEGSQINLDTNTYRVICSIFAIHFGKWRPLPKFEYILVFKGRQKQRVNSIAASTTFTDDVFLINFFYDRNKHITFYRTFDKDNAFEVAKHFQLVLGLDILNATERKQTWLRWARTN